MFAILKHKRNRSFDFFQCKIDFISLVNTKSQWYFHWGKKSFCCSFDEIKIDLTCTLKKSNILHVSESNVLL